MDKRFTQDRKKKRINFVAIFFLAFFFSFSREEAKGLIERLSAFMLHVLYVAGC